MAQPIVLTNRKSLREYRIWQNMKTRCGNRNSLSFKNYGGRGITICRTWMASFDAFMRDMGWCPSPKHSIERLDNGGNYEPSNCVWATRGEQSRNMRTNRMVTWKGETKTITDWAIETGIKLGTLYYRIMEGWPLEKAFDPATLDPVNNLRAWHKSKSKPITFNGETMSLADWSRKIGMKTCVLWERIRRGWSIERALTTPSQKRS